MDHESNAKKLKSLAIAICYHKASTCAFGYSPLQKSQHRH